MEFFPLLIIIVIVFLLVYLKYIDYKQIKFKKDVLKNLRRDSFRIVFFGEGNSYIGFNINSGKFRIGYFSSQQYVELPVTYIEKFEWNWIDRNGEKHSNKIDFYISDINNSLHEIYYGNETRSAKLCYSKINPIIKDSINTQYLEKNGKNQCGYDFFISHASEDKDSFVRKLVIKLQSLGLKIWYDEDELEVGDSLRESIDLGLKNAKFGVVVLSKTFFDKNWPRYELDSLVNRTITDGSKVIIPIWHGVGHKEVSSFSNNLANRVAYNSSDSIDSIALGLLKLINNHSNKES